MKNIAVVLVDRANYGRMKPVMQALSVHPDINLQLVVTGTMLLDRFGRAVEVVEADGFAVDERVYIELEGSIPTTMVKTIGLAIIELGNAFHRLKPDFVVVIGDRYETMGAAIAAVYQNICLVHLQGGEVTGSIDESTRHAITKLAHYHFPATDQAARNIINMGEPRENVFALGCPSADVVFDAVNHQQPGHDDMLDRLGVGPQIDFDRRYVLALFHPVTTEFRSAQQQMNELLEALRQSEEQVILIWPNIDAGSDKVSQAIRIFREHNPEQPLHAYKNFEPERYIPLLNDAACLVGNSSSFIRDASFLGTPVVLVGSRQDGRERSEAVLRVEPKTDAILSALRSQIGHGRYPPSSLYGSDGVASQIVETISGLKPFSQKKLIVG
jgi:UDP-hydrolysing UDP-N-acetyl-D-glucosamine 2-epimerase